MLKEKSEKHCGVETPARPKYAQVQMAHNEHVCIGQVIPQVVGQTKNIGNSIPQF